MQMARKRALGLGYVPGMRLAHSSPIKRLKPCVHVHRRARLALGIVLGAVFTANAATTAQAESTVRLEAPADRAGIAAVTYDDSGAAVGQSSFEIEVLANGNQKMTVRMAIEGGGHSFSEAIFAPIPVIVPSIGPAEKRLESVDPKGPSGGRSSLPSVSSPPSIEGTEVSDGSEEEGVKEEEGERASKKSVETLDAVFRRGPIAGLRLIEQRSQSTRADGTAFELLIVDHAAGDMTCIPDDGADPSKGQRLALPKEDRVVNVPMQLFFLPLVRGEVKEIRFQIAMCKDGPALYEMIAVRGPRKNLGGRDVLEIRYGPNFGKTVAFFASRLMPTFSFWFDAKTGGYLGHRMPLHRDGPEVTLVRSGISPPAIGLKWPQLAVKRWR